MTFVSMTALPLALSTAVAEARGVGVGQHSQVQATAPADHTTASQSNSRGMRMPDKIVAERAPIQVQASEAQSLLEELRLQLAAQPDAILSIRWQLIQPAALK
jgi:hypothetical protein